MIPQIIQIKNFLSYGPQEQIVNFTPYHLIYLSGKNGHGKSALLDAITWAVWGHARKTTGVSRADEGLVHLGQKHMLIIFEFVVNNQRYKIRREYIKTASKPYASLDFCVMQEDNSYKTLTDKTIATTQKKIEDTIGITYDTFVNSVFLRQGQSNEFSKKTPKERKEILANILHLEKFESIKKIASEKLKTFELAQLQQQTMLARIEQELQELTIVIQNLQDQTASHHILQEEIAKAVKHKEQIYARLQALTPLLTQLQTITIEQEFNRKHCKEAQAQYALLQEKIAAIDQEQAQLANYATLQEQHKKVAQELENLQKKAEQRIELKEKFLELQTQKQLLEKEYEQEQSKQLYSITLALSAAQTKLEQLIHNKNQQEQQTTQARQELQHAVQKQHELQTYLQTHLHLEQDLQNCAQTIETLQQEYSTTSAKIDQVTAAEHTIHAKITGLKTTTNTTCELCQQEVSAEHTQIMLATLEQELATTQALYAQNKADQAKTQQLLESAKQKNIQLQTMHNDLVSAQHQKQHRNQEIQKLDELIANYARKQAEIHQQIEDEQKLYNELMVKQQTIRSTTITLEQTPAYQEVQTKLTNVIAQGKELSYDQSYHTKLQQEYKTIETTLHNLADLQHNVTLQHERKAQVATLHKQIDTLQTEYQAQQDKIALLQPTAQEKIELNLQLAAIESELTALHQQQMLILQAQGSLQTQQTKQEKLGIEQKSLKEQTTATQQEIILFQTIIKTVSKDGVQALLIEQAIPEIEAEANFLLAELTNNQTQIFIESLRDLKKGGSKETLDIKISDPLGVRPYEMFSGGEAFRIDFALRIAISKLLARRSGTTLQTLIIDEGFGSQDEEGLHVMMDCITKIQDHFAKIIIISHLPEMKEQFPVEFHVTKKSHGSHIDVIMH